MACVPRRPGCQRALHAVCVCLPEGADQVGGVVAGFAAASLLFRLPSASQNITYADELLRRAKQLYRLATHLPGIWSPPAGQQVGRHEPMHVHTRT